MSLQFFSIANISLRSLPQRLSSSLIIVVGIGGVVAVIVALLAMAASFEKTLQATGKSDRALVLRAGSTSEINGNIPLEQFNIIADFPQVTRVEGDPLSSRETFVTVNMPRQQSVEVASLPMRGVIETSFSVRPEVEIVEGRNIAPGRYELLAGTTAANQFEGLTVGRSVYIRGVDWLVVGVFSAAGGAYESEVWVDERLLAQSWQRGDVFSSMLVQLTSAQAFDSFRTQIQSDRRLTAHTMRESDYYSQQAEGTTTLITGVGLLIGSIMAIGAIFAALNTMFTALSTRAREIATYRALGFQRSAIVGAVLVEAMFLATLGALLGCAIIYLILDGAQLSTVASTSSAFTQVAFSFDLSPDILQTGLIAALVLGFLGGLIPALKAAGIPVVEGLRST